MVHADSQGSNVLEQLLSWELLEGRANFSDIQAHIVLLHPAGDLPSTPLKLTDRTDFSDARFMESFESRHSSQGFTAQLAKELGVTAPPLRLDSQAKYGEALWVPLGGLCIALSV